MEETNMLRIFGQKMVRKINETIRGKCWRMRTNRRYNKIQQGEDILKFIKSLQLRWYGHVKRMQNQWMPKQIATATMEQTKKRGRPRKRWRDEVEEDLNIMGTKNRQAMA
jgi:hypothetical protein